MVNRNLDLLERKIEQKALRRAAKGKPKMAVSGAGVKKLARIIKEKSNIKYHK